jgi:asparagine synthase (glutamine-hydrolysing)
LLKQSVADLLPPNILDRPKQPYRAPDSASFDTPAGKDLVQELLLDGDSPGWGLWRRERVAALVRKWRAGRLSSARDNMAFVAVLSGRMLQRDFGPDFEIRVKDHVLSADQITWRDTPVE